MIKAALIVIAALFGAYGILVAVLSGIDRAEDAQNRATLDEMFKKVGQE